MANRLFIVLEEKNVRQEEVAQALKVTTPTISRWCTNAVQPSFDKLYALSQYLGVEMNYLLYGRTETFSFRKKISLNVLGCDDAYLKIVMGSEDLIALQNTILKVQSDYPDGSMRSYYISLIAYTNLYRPTHISLIEVGRVIQDCSYSTITVESGDENLKMIFDCPSSTTQKVKRR